MSLDPFSCIVKYKMKLMFWPYKMIDCHLTAFFQVHETPPVQETGREFATRSGDIQAVVRFITIPINSSHHHHLSPSSKLLSGLSPSPSIHHHPSTSITIHHRHPSRCQVHHHQFIIIITTLQQHATYPDKEKNFQGCQSCRRCSSCRDLESRRSAQGVQHEGESQTPWNTSHKPSIELKCT